MLVAVRPFLGLPFINFTSLSGLLAARTQNGWTDVQRRCNQMAAELQPEHTGKQRGEELLAGIGEEHHSGNNTRWIIVKGQNKLKIELRERKRRQRVLTESSSVLLLSWNDERTMEYPTAFAYFFCRFCFTFWLQGCFYLLMASVRDPLHLEDIYFWRSPSTAHSSWFESEKCRTKRLCNGGSVGCIRWGYQVSSPVASGPWADQQPSPVQLCCSSVSASEPLSVHEARFCTTQSVSFCQNLWKPVVFGTNDGAKMISFVWEIPLTVNLSVIFIRSCSYNQDWENESPGLSLSSQRDL